MIGNTVGPLFGDELLTAFSLEASFPGIMLFVIFNPSLPYRFVLMMIAVYLTTSLVRLATGARYLLEKRRTKPAPWSAWRWAWWRSSRRYRS